MTSYVTDTSNSRCLSNKVSKVRTNTTKKFDCYSKDLFGILKIIRRAYSE